MTYHDEKLAEKIKRSAAEFIAREAGRRTLITVTGVNLSANDKSATILVTMIPESEEKEALDFLKRHRADFRAFFKKDVRSRDIPFVDFAIDYGERNRQKIDSISNQS